MFKNLFKKEARPAWGEEGYWQACAREEKEREKKEKRKKEVKEFIKTVGATLVAIGIAEVIKNNI